MKSYVTVNGKRYEVDVVRADAFQTAPAAAPVAAPVVAPVAVPAPVAAPAPVEIPVAAPAAAEKGEGCDPGAQQLHHPHQRPAHHPVHPGAVCGHGLLHRQALAGTDDPEHHDLLPPAAGRPAKCLFRPGGPDPPAPQRLRGRRAHPGADGASPGPRAHRRAAHPMVPHPA